MFSYIFGVSRHYLSGNNFGTKLCQKVDFLWSLNVKSVSKDYLVKCEIQNIISSRPDVKWQVILMRHERFKLVLRLRFYRAIEPLLPLTASLVLPGGRSTSPAATGGGERPAESPGSWTSKLVLPGGRSASPAATGGGERPADSVLVGAFSRSGSQHHKHSPSISYRV